jgi:hypothetical protein
LLGLISFFVLAYVIGYFYAFDIAWFSFFSFADHFAFALRAIPVAIGMVMLLLMLIGFSLGVWNNELPKLLNYQRIFRYLLFLWSFVILIFGMYLVKYNHVGPALSLIIVAVCIYFTTIYRRLAWPFLFELLYIGSNVVVLCLVIGFITGISLRDHFFPGVSSMYVIESDKGSSRKTALSMLPPAGHVIFSGSSGVLFYDYGYKHVRFAPWDTIAEIVECRDQLCSTERTVPDPPPLAP